MKIMTMIAGAILATTATVSQPAAAYQLTTTGHTLASRQMTVDILRDISRYSKATDGCVFLFSVHMQVLPRRYTPAVPTPAADRPGVHFEEWSLNACGARQRFQVAIWPLARGGSHYAVTPLTGRMPLYVR